MPDKDDWNKTYLEIFEDYLPWISLAFIALLIVWAVLLVRSIPSSEEIEAARSEFMEKAKAMVEQRSSP